MAFKTIFSVLSVAALAHQAVAAPVNATDIDILGRQAPTVVQYAPIENPKKAAPTHEVTLKQNVNLHYGADDSLAVVKIPKLQFPVVNAAGAATIKDVICTGPSAKVVFGDKAAYDKAAATWSSSFLLTTYSKTCGTGLDGTHDFLFVDKVTGKTPEALTLTVNAVAKDLVEVLDPKTVITVDLGKTGAKSILHTRETLEKSATVGWSKYVTKDQTPFGPGYKLFGNDKASAYCVGCGADGSVKLYAKVSYNLLGVHEAKIGVDGNMNAVGVFGIDGKGSVKSPVKDVQILAVPLEAIKIGKFLTLGPTFTVNVGGQIEVSAKGQLQLGAKLHGNVHAEADLLNSKQNKKGSSFTMDPVHSAKGEVGVTLDTMLTPALNVGVEIAVASFKWKKQVALGDTATLKLSGTVGDKACNKGVMVRGQVFNDLFFDFFGKKLDILKSTLPAQPISKCVK